jgi:uncharacterized membrane protein
MSEAPKRSASSANIAFIAQFSILAAIEAIFCFTPLGSIPFTPAIVATLAGVPIIVTAVMLGVKAGALMGLLTGIFSVAIWTFMPPQPPLAFVFSPLHAEGGAWERLAALFVSVVPRVMVGVCAGASHFFLSKKLPYTKGKAADLWAYGVAGFLGSMANTILVLGAIFLFFGEKYAQLNGLPYSMLLLVLAGVVATNGLAEAAVCVLAAIFICRPLKVMLGKRRL